MYLYEYEKINSFENAFLQEFEEYIINSTKLHKYFKYEWGEIKTQQYCGIINFKDENIFILPKISEDEEENLDIFMYMLFYANNINLENEDLASCKNHKHNIIEVFIQIFANNLLKELKKGIYKEYITEQDNINVLKGKYLINENLKYNFTNSKIYCEYDEFSMNNLLNQFFLFTIKTLVRCVKNKTLLKKCEQILDEVESYVFDTKTISINFNRQNLRFKSSYELALLLLNQFVPLFQKDKKSFAFLFNMNTLFEKFISKIIEKNYENVTVPKNNTNFGKLSLRPDIIINNQKLIIDCKYKIINDNIEISRDDKYQMYVYGNNYYKNINQTMLLYPKTRDSIRKIYNLGENERKVKLLVQTIDLKLNINTYTNYIKKITYEMKEIIDGLQ